MIDMDVDPLARPLAGRLLVATPALRHPAFSRTVILLLDHDDEGSVGVVLNRPLELRVGEAFPQWGRCAALASPEVFFAGGPVETGGALVVAALLPGPLPSGQAPVLRVVPGALAVVDIEAEPTDAEHWARGLRMFAGYSGWGPGQLLDELSEGSWYVVDSIPADLLDPDPAGLWRAVLRRQGGDLALVATWTDAPDHN